MSNFRRRLMMTDKGWLPPGCVELEYLESTGTQWIDTKTTMIDGISINFKINYKKISWTYGTVLPSNNNYGFNSGFTPSNAVYGEFLSTAYRMLTGVNYVIKHSKKSFDINGIISEFPVGTYYNIASTSSIFLFCSAIVTTKSPTGGKASAKIYYFNIFNNGIIIKELIPILDTQGRPCMYDKVSRKFFYNQGTGEFLYKIKQ